MGHPLHDEHDVIRDNDIDLDDSVEFDENGVWYEVDCPNCQQSRDMQIGWKEVVKMYHGKPIKGHQMSAQRTRHGYRLAFRCQICWQNMSDETVDPRRRQRESLNVIEITDTEIDGWYAMGRLLLKKLRGGQPAQGAPRQQVHVQQVPAQQQPPGRRVLVRRPPGHPAQQVRRQVPPQQQQTLLQKIFGK